MFHKRLRKVKLPNKSNFLKQALKKVEKKAQNAAIELTFN